MNAGHESNEEKNLIMKVHKPGWIERLFFFVSGTIVSVPLTLFIQSNLGSVFPIIASIPVSAVVFAPLVEEFAKAYPLVFRHGETERSIVVLGFLVGLGFGISEFILYVFVLNVDAISRVIGILFHAASASITVYGIATRKPFRYYLISVGLHFSNNYLAVCQQEFWYPLGPLISIFTILLALALYQRTTERFIRY